MEEAEARAAALLQAGDARGAVLCQEECLARYPRETVHNEAFLLRHLLALWMHGDSDGVRMAWKRVPSALRGEHSDDSPLRSLWFSAERWESGEYGIALACLASVQWPEYAQPLVAMLVEDLKKKQLALIGRAYTRIARSAAAEMLGMSEDQAVEACEAEGWTCGAEFIEPKPIAAAKAAASEEQRTADSRDQAAQAGQIRTFAQYVTALERQNVDVQFPSAADAPAASSSSSSSSSAAAAAGGHSMAAALDL